MDFQLQYYDPSVGTDAYLGSDNVASGAYIFKPNRYNPDKTTYSSFVNIENYKGANTGVQAFAAYYTNDLGEMYTALIRLMPA